MLLETGASDPSPGRVYAQAADASVQFCFGGGLNVHAEVPCVCAGGGAHVRVCVFARARVSLCLRVSVSLCLSPSSGDPMQLNGTGR